MKIDIVVCTYNRPLRVISLVQEILTCNPLPNSIIIVDSSDVFIENNVIIENTNYIKSSHKNQPYQRFLGYMISSADILIYLDDDMEILDSTFFQNIKTLFYNIDIVGVGFAFKNKHLDIFLNKTPKSILQSISNSNKLLHNLRSFSGYGELPTGKFGWNGLRGRQPIQMASTEWFGGGAFAARKNDLFQNFNFQLLDLFEKKIGMGEDMMISYTLSKRGKLLFYPEVKFLHNDQKDSTYTPDFYSYAYRVMYSRLFLSLEYARLNNYPLYLANIKFNWYAFWRLIGQLLNIILKPSYDRKETLKGSIMGWKDSFSLKINNMDNRNQFWITEVHSNLSNCSL